MSGYRLTASAKWDLAEVRSYYRQQAGPRVARQMLEEFAEAFRFLGRNPEAGHERQDLARGRPLLFWPVREYLIIYLAGSQPLRVVMVVHGRRDVPSMIRRYLG